MADDVPTGVLREALEKSGLTPLDVAKNLGWRNSEGVFDGRRVKRYIGLQKYSVGGKRKRKMQFRKKCRYSTAITMIRGMDLDPVDFGL